MDNKIFGIVDAWFNHEDSVSSTAVGIDGNVVAVMNIFSIPLDFRSVTVCIQ